MRTKPRFRVRSGLIAALGLLLLGVDGPAGCPWRAGLLVLEPESTLTEGCFPPCLCPLYLSEPVVGRLGLVEFHGEPIAQFREFAVPAVHWRTRSGGQEVLITGSGHYRVGGEFALLHQLSLDLAIGDEPVQHFDSGLVPGGSDFPKLDIEISLHGGYCYDRVIDVVASSIFSTW
jgi:hypothetical protein